MNVRVLYPKQALQCYLMCSLAYYHQYTSLIPDEDYDYLAKFLLETWDDWQDHQHAHLVTKGDLTAGTLFMVRYDQYPTMIKLAADDWMREHYYQHGG